MLENAEDKVVLRNFEGRHFEYANPSQIPASVAESLKDRAFSSSDS